jgi:2,3-bisphosphoglycerate-dependent phosphoglycerate mutase
MFDESSAARLPRTTARGAREAGATRTPHVLHRLRPRSTSGTARVMSRLLLVRHCEASGPYPKSPLTERGRAQAEHLAAFLGRHPVDALVSSPFTRARESIAPFARASGLPVAVDPRLAERRMSAAPDPAWRERLRRAFDEPDGHAPGGESAREAVTRGRAAIDDLLASGHRLPAAVSHGQLISLVLHAVDPRFGFAGWESLTTPDVYLLESDGGHLRFERWWPEAR